MATPPPKLWTCEHCSQANPDSAQRCQHCGNKR